MDMPVNGGIFAEVSLAKAWCSEHEQERRLDEHVAKVVAEAPPLSSEQARNVARIFDIEGSRAQRRAERQPHPASAPPPRGLTKRNLPGAPERSNEEVLTTVRKEWEEGLAKTPMYSMWFTSPEDMFRWRVQFDCGCIEDWCNTSDDPQSLLDATRHNPFAFLDGKKNLPPGEYLCKGIHLRPDLPLREVMSWDELLCEKVIPLDPVEPPDWWGKAMANRAEHKDATGDEFDGEPEERCEDIRRAEPQTVVEWTATLTCGHGMKTTKDLDWTPDQGVIRSWETVADVLERHAKRGVEPRGLTAKMLAAGWPDDWLDMDCSLCPIVRKPVAYEPLGWLVPPPKPPRKPRQYKSPKELKAARLWQVEREAKKLRAELKALERKEDPS
ncbi:hypothetical protein [Mycolicibacterium sp.]|uniref:hypothetical protein n=1 Tax=Mycolicibacterium sp. TaxID=2320850 RepID=UPI001A2B6785|nr:hypothetical protein [Mycolicibacterium sp.]MBJ7340632.1 hypothetical protein [Mycolicibacterium sp.]